MNDEVQEALRKFEDAFVSLKAIAQAKAPDEFTRQAFRDSTIQRFEYTWDLAWKTLKIILKHQGIECRNPKDCFKKAFSQEIIQDEANYLRMLEDRNETSHTYNKAFAEEISGRIVQSYVRLFEILLGKLKSIH